MTTIDAQLAPQFAPNALGLCCSLLLGSSNLLLPLTGDHLSKHDNAVAI
eukprot:CAMPEP_0170596402 /NCGR_PEP_ID=MMETSP0224-20130122/15096_1 /TAXON_ID=285029 /ORGANISM="Togula jolla, Strain CCCM 725" /LENGTH=48 /DNA_ID= /DNA_START= /DNA_END= /DNA_ORIENTATION=